MGFLRRLFGPVAEGWFAPSTAAPAEPLERRTIPAVYPIPNHQQYIQGNPLPGAGGTYRWPFAIPAVTRAVHILSSQARQPDLQEERRVGSAPQERWVPVAPADLIRRPDPDITRGEFQNQYVTHMAVTGEAAIRLFRDPGGDLSGPVRSARLLQGPEFQIEWAGVPGSSRRRYLWRGQELQEWRDLLHIRYLTLPGELHGLGPIQAAVAELSAQLSMQGWMASNYTTAAVPAGAIQVPHELDKGEAQEVLDEWELGHQGISRTGVLSGGASWVAAGLSAVDVQFVETRLQSVQEVAGLFGVDPYLLAAAMQGSSLTYQNLRDVLALLFKLTLAPAYLDPLEEHLSEVIRPSHRARFNFEPLTRPDERTRMDIYATAIPLGVLTLEEVREREGRPPPEQPQLAPVSRLGSSAGVTDDDEEQTA